MIRLAVPIVVLLLVLLAGAVWALFGYLNLPPLTEQPSVERPLAAKGEAPGTAPKPAGPSSAQDGTASFDVVRIDPNGTSVFAGRAEPGAQVTITGDGETIGTVAADQNGEWTFTVERKFASAEPALRLRVKPAAEVKREAAAAATQVAGRAEKQTAAVDAGAGQSAKSVTSDLLKNLEGMVAEARNADQQAPVTAQSAPPSDAGSTVTVRLSTSPQPSGPAVSKSVPVPITFIFNEANLTDDGRRAAGLLLEYLKLKHFSKVSLTGHADERGTEEFNLELSRQRLDTVAQFLKENGYGGELELIPKGKSEPFSGVVRSDYNQEDLWQLDRRVELVITR